MSSPADAFIQMERPTQQEGVRDGFRDAMPERTPGQLLKWREKLSIVTGADLAAMGYVRHVEPDEAFILGELPEDVVEAMQSGVPDDCPTGQWIRHLTDLMVLSWQRVRFNEKSNPLAALANVDDGESALRFVKRYGFPVTHQTGFFLSRVLNRANPHESIQFALPRPVASLNDVFQEASFLRSIVRLKEVREHPASPVELQEIEKDIFRFAGKEKLAALTLGESLRLFKPGETARPTVEEIWAVALTAADSRVNRLVRPSNALQTNPVVYEAHSILGHVYLQLRRELIGPESPLRQCANRACLRWFKPITSAMIHCSESCRRQVHDRKRARSRAKPNVD